MERASIVGGRPGLTRSPAATSKVAHRSSGPKQVSHLRVAARGGQTPWATASALTDVLVRLGHAPPHLRGPG